MKIVPAVEETPVVAEVVNIVSVGLPLLTGPSSCLAQWTKTVDCPAGSVYRDEREHAGREEFCEQRLPGSLKVKDGPYRSWLSEGHPGEQGNYSQGRKVGPWTECDRFDHCKQMAYEMSEASEKRRKSFRPEIPLTYAKGKYIFDFASCRSTWVTQVTDGSSLELNIYGMEPYRCQITYMPQHAMRNGGQGEYLCRIPFAVGTRELRSLDLKRELLDLGLPQFCNSISKTGETLLILKKGSVVVTTVDIQCASTEHDEAGHEILNIRLNQYADELLREVASQQGSLKTLLCMREIDERESSVDGSGRSMLSYRLSRDPAKAQKEIAHFLRRCHTVSGRCRHAVNHLRRSPHSFELRSSLRGLGREPSLIFIVPLLV
jgi:hypothetical protein